MAQTLAQLKDLYRRTAQVIMRRLDRDSNMQQTWDDGRPTADVVAEFIKPNDRLSSFQRIEIYNRQYWFRLIDCLYDDYPGLRAVVGDRKFNRLVIEYLDARKSRSYTLRNLGSRLEQFIVERPDLVSPRAAMATEMARFEWAQVVAFDGEARPSVGVDDLLGTNSAKLRLALQPYITLLQLSWPWDDWSIALKKAMRSLRSEASNAVDIELPASKVRPKLPKKQRIFVAVHRHDGALYYKRLEPDAFAMLSALGDGQSLADAVGAAINSAANTDRDLSADVQKWFANWAGMGWFCKRK